MSLDDLLHWQLEKIESHARLLQEHAADPTCACELDLTSCLRKHCLMLESYATETLPMVQDERLAGLLYDLSIEARDMKEKVAASVCGDGEAELDLAEVAQFGREWAKRVETGYTCPISSNPESEEVAMSSPGNIELWLYNPRPDEWYVMKQVGEGEDSLITTMGFARTKQEAEWMLAGIKVSGGIELGSPGIGGALVTGAGIGAGLVIAQKVLEKKGNGGSNPHNPIALSVCEKEHGLGPKLDSCIFKMEELNIEKGCPPMGLGTKECPNPVAVCRASISQPVCSAKAESPKV